MSAAHCGSRPEDLVRGVPAGGAPHLLVGGREGGAQADRDALADERVPAQLRKCARKGEHVQGGVDAHSLSQIAMRWLACPPWAPTHPACRRPASTAAPQPSPAHTHTHYTARLPDRSPPAGRTSLVSPAQPPRTPQTPPRLPAGLPARRSTGSRLPRLTRPCPHPLLAAPLSFSLCLSLPFSPARTRRRTCASSLPGRGSNRSSCRRART